MLVSNNRKEILATLGSSHNSIILSPSVETGYDFKDDLARWQIIAKVPFLNLGDNYVNVRKNKNNDWYTREAVLRLIQACGRIVRGLDDYGSTYIIDENVLRLISSNTEMFPEWWLNALEMN
jgi:Rad3-related DNA helicase